jgi:DNA-binding NarL/FixJ family response regulator
MRDSPVISNERTIVFAFKLPFPQETDAATTVQGAVRTLAGPQPHVNPTLSFREKQVVDLVCKGKQNKQIAHELHLTEGTVKEYLTRIFRKVGSTSRTELAIWAITTRGAVSFMPVSETMTGNV